MTALPTIFLAVIAVRLFMMLPVVALAWIGVLREWRAYRAEAPAIAGAHSAEDIAPSARFGA
jgi:hypothetical protein